MCMAVIWLWLDCGWYCLLVDLALIIRDSDVAIPVAAEGEAYPPEVAEQSRLGRKPVGQKCEMRNVKCKPWEAACWRQEVQCRTGPDGSSLLTTGHWPTTGCVTHALGYMATPRSGKQSGNIHCYWEFFSQLTWLLSFAWHLRYAQKSHAQSYQVGLLATATKVVFSLKGKKVWCRCKWILFIDCIHTHELAFKNQLITNYVHHLL